jgi:hypothetical protein
MTKGVFDQNLEEMVEFDKELDINAILDSTPALEIKTEEKPEDTKVEKKEEEVEKPTLKNIDKVLEQQSKEIEKDKKVVDDSEEKTDDKASASLKTTLETSSDAPFTVIFARDLVAQGLLSSFDEGKFIKDSKDLGDAEALRNLIKSEIDTNIEAAKSDLDSGYQEYLSLVGKGVVPETAGSLLELKTRFEQIKIDDLTKDENTDLRKQVLTDYFKLTTSMSDKKIEKLVQSSIDLGDDVEDAKEYHGILTKLVKDQIVEEERTAQELETARREEIKRTSEVLKDDINTLEEIIPGVGINKQTKVKMFDAITKPVQDKQGRTTNAIWAKRAEDPTFFDTRLAYLLETGFFEKGKTWTKAGQAKVTKEATELERVLKSKGGNTDSKIGSPVLRSPELDKTTKDNIDSMRGIFGK